MILGVTFVDQAGGLGDENQHGDFVLGLQIRSQTTNEDDEHSFMCVTLGPDGLSDRRAL